MIEHTPLPDEYPADPLALLDAMQTMTASLTGMKRQLTDAGWTDQGAEAAVIAIIHGSAQR